LYRIVHDPGKTVQRCLVPGSGVVNLILQLIHLSGCGLGAVPGCICGFSEGGIRSRRHEGGRQHGDDGRPVNRGHI
jgi:hypothetical protein